VLGIPHDVPVLGYRVNNGVAALHSELVATRLLADFARLRPNSFLNVTNGVPPRRWLAMANPARLSPYIAALAIVMFSFGSLINTAADVQKTTAKELGAGLVQDASWRRIRHVNYFGDLIRYASFAVLAGSAWAWLLPASVLLVYLQRIAAKERALEERYPGFPAYRARSWRLIPGVW
jgi:protein-S-isoprenylcysteine O-methyltransferase Ste14